MTTHKMKRFWDLFTFGAVVCMGTAVALSARHAMGRSKHGASVHTLEDSIIHYAKGEITKEEFDSIKRGLELA
jgi:uncharacterized membrane protein